MIRKMISGGQSGADEGGLRAGKRCSLETGGHMPLGFLTETGFRPEMAELYGMTEHTSNLYPPRTILNVANSDGTIRFASDFTTAGERCTLRAIKDLKKPHIDIKVHDPLPIADVVKWIRGHQIQVLNVAGNRESTFPGLCQFVEDYLCNVIRAIMEPEETDAG